MLEIYKPSELEFEIDILDVEYSLVSAMLKNISAVFPELAKKETLKMYKKAQKEVNRLEILEKEAVKLINKAIGGEYQ